VALGGGRAHSRGNFYLVTRIGVSQKTGEGDLRAGGGIVLSGRGGTYGWRRKSTASSEGEKVTILSVFWSSTLEACTREKEGKKMLAQNGSHTEKKNVQKKGKEDGDWYTRGGTHVFDEVGSCQSESLVKEKKVPTR